MFTKVFGFFGGTTAAAGGDFFAVQKYTGDGNDDRDINVTPNIQPDLAIIKKRNDTSEWGLVDSTRGPTIKLDPATTAAELTRANHFQAFNSNGVEIGTDNEVNQNFGTYILYTWRESNGLDVVSYTGNGVARNISHSLGSVPQMMIVKTRPVIDDWNVYHSGLDRGNNPERFKLRLNSSATEVQGVFPWNNTKPTSTVFRVGTGNEVNKDGDAYIAYLFAAIAGRSAFGRYLGQSGEDPLSITGLGFQPNCVIIKTADEESGAWSIWDSQRGVKKFLRLDRDDAEITSGEEAEQGLLSFDTDGFTVGFSEDVNRGSETNHIWAAWK